MKLAIKSTNITLTSAIRAYIDEKLTKRLERHLPVRNASSVEGWVEVGKTTKHHIKGMVFRAEVQLHLPGKKTVRVESVSENLYRAIDGAKEELKRILKKYRGRQSALYKRRARRLKKDTHLSRAARFYQKGRIREERI